MLLSTRWGARDMSAEFNAPGLEACNLDNQALNALAFPPAEAVESSRQEMFDVASAAGFQVSMVAPVAAPESFALDLASADHTAKVPEGIGRQPVEGRFRRLSAAVLAFALVTGGALAESVVAAGPASANTITDSNLGYPWPNEPCEYKNSAGQYVHNPSGNLSCGSPATNPPNASGNWGNWGEVVNGAFQQYRDGYEYDNCTDFVQWKVDSEGGYVPLGLGDGGSWYANAPSADKKSSPEPGYVAVAPGEDHVAWVQSVSGNNITVQEYNADEEGDGDTQTGTPASMGFTEYLDFGGLPSGGGGSTPPPAPPQSPNAIDVQKVYEPDGTNQVYSTTSSDVYESWWNSTTNGPVTTHIIGIAQNNIVGSSEVDAPNGDQELYTATSTGIWETWWNATQPPTSSEIVQNLSGVEQIYATTENDSGTTSFELYVREKTGIFQYWFNSGSNGVQSDELYAVSNPIDMVYSNNPTTGAEEIFTATPGNVEETTWTPGGTITDTSVIGISQNNITAISKTNDGSKDEILDTATSVGDWESEWGGTVGAQTNEYMVNNFSGAVAVSRIVDTNGTNELYLANGSEVQRYWWNATTSGGGTAITVSQNDISAIAVDDNAGTEHLYTAAGPVVWETWSNSTGGDTDAIVNISQQQG
jgi:surface antigen